MQKPKKRKEVSLLKFQKIAEKREEISKEEIANIDKKYEKNDLEISNKPMTDIAKNDEKKEIQISKEISNGINKKEIQTSKEVAIEINKKEKVISKETMADVIKKDGKKETQISKETIVVDGSNVAWTDIDKKDGKPSAKKILNVVNCLKQRGFKNIVVIAGASLRHYINDLEIFNQLKKDGVLKEAPAKRDEDSFIIKYAIEKNAYIITNDTFRNRLEKYPNLEKLRIPFMLIDETITFDEKLDSLKEK